MYRYGDCLAVFLTGLTFIVLMRLPDLLDVLIAHLRPRDDVALAAGQTVDAADDQDGNAKN